jgi:hypothetical protein
MPTVGFSDTYDVSFGEGDTSTITFLLNDVDLSGQLQLAASVAEGTTHATMEGHVVVDIDVSCSVIHEIFKFQTDASSIDDISATDLLYKQDLKYNSYKFRDYVMNALTSSDFTTTGDNNPPAGISLAHEYIQFIALNVFGTRKGVDILNNEEALDASLNEDLSGAFTTYINTHSVGNALDAASSYDVSTTTYDQLSRKLLQVIMRADSTRLDVSGGSTAYTNYTMQDQTTFQPVPIRAGDYLILKYTVNDTLDHCADLGDHSWNAANGSAYSNEDNQSPASRSYLIRMTVTNN